MQKWEYIELALERRNRKWHWGDTGEEATSTTSVGRRLTQMGMQGWEVVAATPQNVSGTTDFYYYLLKRALA